MLLTLTNVLNYLKVQLTFPRCVLTGLVIDICLNDPPQLTKKFGLTKVIVQLKNRRLRAILSSSVVSLWSLLQALMSPFIHTSFSLVSCPSGCSFGPFASRGGLSPTWSHHCSL